MLYNTRNECLVKRAIISKAKYEIEQMTSVLGSNNVISTLTLLSTFIRAFVRQSVPFEVCRRNVCMQSARRSSIEDLMPEGGNSWRYYVRLKRDTLCPSSEWLFAGSIQMSAISFHCSRIV